MKDPSTHQIDTLRRIYFGKLLFMRECLIDMRRTVEGLHKINENMLDRLDSDSTGPAPKIDVERARTVLKAVVGLGLPLKKIAGVLNERGVECYTRRRWTAYTVSMAIKKWRVRR